jgi:SAM-dependent methyltransferase
MQTPPFWERSEQVEMFAGREPDRRLLELIGSYPHPQRTRVLDIGCAGGRNTVVLAEHGFDVYAIDSSSAMVEKTRERLARVLGASEMQSRVRVGHMQDLGDFDSASFHLVVALGIYHSATTREEWDRTLGETARVLVPGGQVLVANFSPQSDPGGEGLRPVPGEPHVYEGFDAGPLLLLEADELDAELARHDLVSVVPTETVVTPTEAGRRVTVNGLYRKGQRETRGRGGRR